MSWKYYRPARVSPDAACDIILRPVVTEKSVHGSEFNQVTFRVPLRATKPVIRAAVELLFEVEVRSVNTVRCKGKVKRFRGRIGRQADYKKAIVCLEDGYFIDIETGF